MTFKPYQHQLRGVGHALTHPHALYNWGMGTGKTAMMLSTLEESKAFPALVLCPKTILWAAWQADAEKFFPRLRVAAITGNREERIFKLTSSEYDIAVMGYESARATPEIAKVPWKALIFDESTRLRFRRGGVNFAMAQQLSKLPSVKRRYCLSGNPWPNGIMEIWGQMHVVLPGVLPVSFYAFRNEYFYQPNRQNAQWLWVPKPGAEKRILDKIEPFVSYLDKKTCIDLPPQTDVIRHVALKDEGPTYWKFISEFVVELASGKVSSYSALAELMKCRQMTAGVVRCDDGEWREIGLSKLEATIELIEDLGKPVVVVAQFRKEIERLAKALNEARKLPVLLYGEMTDRQRQDSIARFNAGVANVMIGHPASMGHGLTLNAADMIFTSLDYSWDTHGQVKERLAPLRGRGDAASPCTYYYLLAPGTIDEDIYRALSKKQSVGLEILEKFSREQSLPEPAERPETDGWVLVENER